MLLLLLRISVCLSVSRSLPISHCFTISLLLLLLLLPPLLLLLLLLLLQQQAVKNFATGSQDNCTYDPKGYYGGNCNCTSTSTFTAPAADAHRDVHHH